VKDGPATVVDFVARGAIDLAFQMDREVGAVRTLMAQYASAPISLADVCLFA
jgi:hypothetical protein